MSTYFYTFEFLQRGTLHMHLLVWLRDISKTDFKRFRADVPGIPEPAFSIRELQKSDKPSPFLHLSDEPTSASRRIQTLTVQHNAKAFTVHHGAYIDTRSRTLNCSMDVPTTHGSGMLMRYTSSYVSKWSDAFDSPALFTSDLNAHHAAFKYLRNLRTCEAEIYMTLASFKVAWNSSTTKRYTLRSPDNAVDSKRYQKYLRRPAADEHLTFLQWLRVYDDTPVQPKLYTFGDTLVGVNYLSVTNDVFFQYLSMNYSHRNLADLQHPDSRRMPSHLVHFATAQLLLPNLFANDNAECRAILFAEGHKEYHINNVISFLSAMKHSLQLWQLGVIPSASFQLPSLDTFPFLCEAISWWSSLTLNLRWQNAILLCSVGPGVPKQWTGRSTSRFWVNPDVERPTR